jgi:hypothetical protein
MADDSMKITCHVDLHGLEEDLIQLGPKIARRIFRKLLTTIGKLWADDVRAKVPVDEGTLKDSIGYVVTTSPKNDFASVTVGPTYDTNRAKNQASRTEDPGIYGLFVEYGLKKRKYTFTPFMRPTFDATAEAIITLFAAGLREDLEAAIKE